MDHTQNGTVIAYVHFDANPSDYKAIFTKIEASGLQVRITSCGQIYPIVLSERGRLYQGTFEIARFLESLTNHDDSKTHNLNELITLDST